MWNDASMWSDNEMGFGNHAPSRPELFAFATRAADTEGLSLLNEMNRAHAAGHAGVRTFFTRHMSLPRELMGAFQYRMAMAWQRVDDPRRSRHV